MIFFVASVAKIVTLAWFNFVPNLSRKLLKKLTFNGFQQHLKNLGELTFFCPLSPFLFDFDACLYLLDSGRHSPPQIHKSAS